MRVVVQVGFSRNAKEGQLISARHNGIEVKRKNGQFATALAQRFSSNWFLAELECADDDIIIVDVKTGIRQKGADEHRTFRKTYRVHASLGVSDVIIPNVGKFGCPLIKGRIQEIASVSKEDERRKDIEAFLEDGGF